MRRESGSPVFNRMKRRRQDGKTGLLKENI
jgi:hypothetical protein